MVRLSDLPDDPKRKRNIIIFRGNELRGKPSTPKPSNKAATPKRIKQRKHQSKTIINRQQRNIPRRTR